MSKELEAAGYKSFKPKSSLDQYDMLWQKVVLDEKQVKNIT